MEKKQELRFGFAVTERSHHVCSVQPDFSLSWLTCVYSWRGAEFGRQTRDSHSTFCKPCWLSLICIQKYCLCDERDGLSSGEIFQGPKWPLSSPLSQASQLISFVRYPLWTDGSSRQWYQQQREPNWGKLTPFYPDTDWVIWEPCGCWMFLTTVTWNSVARKEWGNWPSQTPWKEMDLPLWLNAWDTCFKHHELVPK